MNYELPKHRFYELKHFCMQYPMWKQLYSEELNKSSGNCSDVDPTAKHGISRADYATAISLVEDCCAMASIARSYDILEFVTTGSVKGCSDDIFDLVRKFYWILDKEKGL